MIMMVYSQNSVPQTFQPAVYTFLSLPDGAIKAKFKSEIQIQEIDVQYVLIFQPIRKQPCHPGLQSCDLLKLI